MDRNRVRASGVDRTVGEAVTHLNREGGPSDGFWIHLDADALDESIMQAVDDPRPNGLSWEEVAVALHTAMDSGRAVGLQITIYNPDFDGDRSNGRGLAATINGALVDFVSARD